MRLTGWSPFGGNVMQADLPAGVSHVRYLHDGSEEWMERSATAMFNPATVAFEGSPENEHFEPEYQVNKTFCVYPADFSPPDWSQAAQYDLRIKNMPLDRQHPQDRFSRCGRPPDRRRCPGALLTQRRPR